VEAICRSLTGDIATNPEHLIVSDYHTPWGGFYAVDNGFYYTSAAHAGVFRFYSFDAGSSVDVGPAPSKLGLGLTVSPDRTRLAYSTNVGHMFMQETCHDLLHDQDQISLGTADLARDHTVCRDLSRDHVSIG
jgi:hypothetical protein